MKINFDFDENNNILYVSLADMSNSYGDENIDGVIIFRDIDTDKVTGVTIMG